MSTLQRHAPLRVTMNRHALTLVEMLIVVTILAILAAIALPTVQSLGGTQLAAAGRLLSADVEFAQAESIAHPDDPRLIRFDVARATYWVAAKSNPLVPIRDPAGPSALLVQFGDARGAGLEGVGIQSIDLGGDAELRFDAWGRPDQAQPARVVLQSGATTLTVTVAASTGDVSVAQP